MKILQINIFYNEGSTGKIVADIHQRLLRDGHDSYVVFGRGKDWQLEDSMHLYRTTTENRSNLYLKLAHITGLRYNTAYLETYKLLKHIDGIKPDIIHLHCLNCAYVQPFILLDYLGKKGYPVLVTHHADVTITANCDYAFDCEKWKTGCGGCKTNKTEKRSFLIDGTHLSWKQMQKAFSTIKNLYASGVSEWMSNRVRQSPFFIGKECRTILNGLDTDAYTYKVSCEKLRNKLGITKVEKIVIHVTPNFSASIKGGKYVIELARRMPAIKFIIVGIKSWEIKGLPENVIPITYLGSKNDMAEYYSMADITLLPSYRESFSMVTAESLCCGTPVVGFKAGAPETIAIPEYSDFVDYGDIDALEKALEVSMGTTFDKSHIADLSKSKYDAEIMYQSYLEYYKHIASHTRENKKVPGEHV